MTAIDIPLCMTQTDTLVFATKPWACSMTQIDWSSEGFEGTKLAYLACAAGFFFCAVAAFACGRPQ